jgi:hypothetical protein
MTDNSNQSDNEYIKEFQQGFTKKAMANTDKTHLGKLLEDAEKEMADDYIVKFGSDNDITVHITDKLHEEYDIEFEMSDGTVTENGNTKPTGELEKVSLSITKKKV